MSPLEKNCVPLSSRIHTECLQQWQQHYHSDLSCPICLQTANFPVETNCGHLFCGPRTAANLIKRLDVVLKCPNPQIPWLKKGYCLIEYWKHGSWLRAISCPLCRQKVAVFISSLKLQKEVVLLYNTYSETQPDKQSKQTFYDIRAYNKRFSGQPQPFIDHLHDVPLLVPVILRGIFTLGGLVWIFFLRVVICSFGTIMSLTSPLEVMPEPLCGILQAADNLAVVILLLISMINICTQMESEGVNMTTSRAQNITLES